MTTKPNAKFTKLTRISDGKTAYISKNKPNHDKLVAQITKEWDRP